MELREQMEIELQQPNYTEIGERIREIRLRLGWSQEQLAEQCGLSKTHMSHIETGNTKGSLPVFLKICNVLQVSLDDIVCDSLSCEVDAYHKQIAELMKDCSPLELRKLVDVLKAAKCILRKYDNEKM